MHSATAPAHAPRDLATVAAQPAVSIVFRGANPRAARSPALLVLAMPRRSRLVARVIARAGLVAVAPLPLGFLPFDAGLVSLDWCTDPHHIALEGYNGSLQTPTPCRSAAGAPSAVHRGRDYPELAL